MPLILEEVKEITQSVAEQTEKVNSLINYDSISDVAFLMCIGLILFFFSKFIGVIFKWIGLIIITLCAYTIFMA
jgi:hypothetical protein